MVKRMNFFKNIVLAHFSKEEKRKNNLQPIPQHFVDMANQLYMERFDPQIEVITQPISGTIYRPLVKDYYAAFFPCDKLLPVNEYGYAERPNNQHLTTKTMDEAQWRLYGHYIDEMKKILKEIDEMKNGTEIATLKFPPYEYKKGTWCINEKGCYIYQR